MKIKIPNYLTIGRIIIVPIFVIAYYLPGFYGDLIPFILFLIASFTDFLDGLLARMFKEESKLGRDYLDSYSFANQKEFLKKTKRDIENIILFKSRELDKRIYYIIFILYWENVNAKGVVEACFPTQNALAKLSINAAIISPKVSELRPPGDGFLRIT